MNEIAKSIEKIMVYAQNLRASSELFSIESQVFERLYDQGDTIKTEILTCIDGLNEIQKNMGTTLQSLTASMDRDRYRRSLRKMVNLCNNDLIPAYQKVGGRFSKKSNTN